MHEPIRAVKFSLGKITVEDFSLSRTSSRYSIVSYFSSIRIVRVNHESRESCTPVTKRGAVGGGGGEGVFEAV